MLWHFYDFHLRIFVFLLESPNNNSHSLEQIIYFLVLSARKGNINAGTISILIEMQFKSYTLPDYPKLCLKNTKIFVMSKPRFFDGQNFYSDSAKNVQNI